MARVSVVEVKGEEVDPWVVLFDDTQQAERAVRRYMLELQQSGVVEVTRLDRNVEEPHRVVLRHRLVEFILTIHD